MCFKVILQSLVRTSIWQSSLIVEMRNEKYQMAVLFEFVINIQTEKSLPRSGLIYVFQVVSNTLYIQLQIYLEYWPLFLPFHLLKVSLKFR